MHNNLSHTQMCKKSHFFLLTYFELQTPILLDGGNSIQLIICKGTVGLVTAKTSTVVVQVTTMNGHCGFCDAWDSGVFSAMIQLP